MKLKHLLHALGLLILLRLLRCMPLDVASAFGGWLGVRIGPRLSSDKVARHNLTRVFPEKTDAERDVIRLAMWNNLGRVAAEFAFLRGNALFSRVTYKSLENLPAGATLFISGHFGNWELSYPAAHQYGVPVTLIYRRANNPLVEKIISNTRQVHSTDMLQKGQQGALKMARTIRDGGSLALLVDQKYNEGISVPFLGHDAMTAPMVAQLALRYNLPITPMRVLRTNGAHFEAKLYPAILPERTGDDDADALAILNKIHRLIEAWVRENPEQWFWVHRRWPD